MNEYGLSIARSLLLIFFFFMQSCVSMEQKELMEELAESAGAPAR